MDRLPTCWLPITASRNSVPLANFYSSNVVAWVKTLETTNRLRRTDYMLDHCDGLRLTKQ